MLSINHTRKKVIVKIFPLLLTALISVAFAACSGGSEPTPTPFPTPTAVIGNKQDLARYLNESFIMYEQMETLVNKLGEDLLKIDGNQAGNEAEELRIMGEFATQFKSELAKQREKSNALVPPEEAKAHLESLRVLDNEYAVFVDTLAKGIADNNQAMIAEAFTMKYPKPESVTSIGIKWQELAIIALRSKPSAENDYMAAAIRLQMDYTTELNTFFANFEKAGAIVPHERPEVQKAFSDAIKILNRFHTAWNSLTPPSEFSASHTSYAETITDQVKIFGKISQANDVGNQAEMAKLEQERIDATTKSIEVTRKWNESVSAALAKIAEA